MSQSRSDVAVEVPAGSVDGGASQSLLSSSSDAPEDGFLTSALHSDELPGHSVKASARSALSIASLAKLMLGGTFISLPYTASHLGLLPACALAVLIALATHWSLVGLCRSSDAIGTTSYKAVVADLLGTRVAWGLAVRKGQGLGGALSLLSGERSCSAPSSPPSPNPFQVALVLEGASMMAVCINSMTDAALAASPYLTAHVTRPGVAAAICVCCLLPLSLARSMNQTGVLAAGGVAAIAGLVVLLCVLSRFAAADGTSHHLPLWPHLDAGLSMSGSLLKARCCLRPCLSCRVFWPHSLYSKQPLRPLSSYAAKSLRWRAPQR